MPSRPSRPRLEDVASRAGVSTASVSLVLRGQPGPSASTRESVLDAARELGYRPDRTASLLARRRTKLLGVTMDVSSAFHAELLEDIQAAADERGYDIVISPLTRTRDERRAVESLLDFRCEALLLLGPTLTDPELAALAMDHHVVAIGRRAAAAGVDVVRAADDAGVALAVAHLVDLGHRSIAFVDGPRGPISALRRRGYRSAVRRLVGGDAVLVVPGGSTEDAGGDAARRVLSTETGERPTALVAFNDRAALGVLDRLRREGVEVPGGMSVVGYDDSPIARLATVDLTSVSQAPEAMAVAAVQAATERLDSGRTQAVDVVLDPHLVVRGTTGPPAHPRVDVFPRAGARGNTSTGEVPSTVRQPPGL
ncbi:LacI family transcriptional regulator [Intrasporangium oryzae NRRL B-24470]|uniref:LacI family transcriptional regulator n=1 Tax=Intrasporangium oryzae NRRL B-24470 TaxID=1386089 RepID=W9G7K7_9MICO|nr:LacI family DNA-binding transcriptional regulator [Intrasporangium oryzae]EWT02171.1 LacI family transcriptional regulator [Intrasporangium oryzae NRRL B-24470]